MVSLQLLVYSDKFNVFVDSRYFGQILKMEGIWTCFPEQRIEDIDSKIKCEVDRVLRVLNNET
jgi:hypothetical protein